MIAITPDQVTAEILALFDFTKPTMPRAFNVLEGVHRGEILVNNMTHPTWAVVRDVIYGTLYFGGQVDGPLVKELVEKYRAAGEVGIGCWPDDPLNEMIPAGPDYDGRTLYFTERSRPPEGTVVPLAPGYRLVVRNEELLTKSPDYQATLEAFGSVEAVFKNTLGVLVLKDDEFVCEAATGAPTRGWIEVGVTTAEPYRGQGFAGIACARLIELCEGRSYRTWWDCAKQNTPSVKLAHKLGYRNEREYRYVWWRKAG